MEPAFYRGDLLFLYHDREVIRSYNLELITSFNNNLSIYDNDLSIGPYKRWRNCCFQN